MSEPSATSPTRDVTWCPTAAPPLPRAPVLPWRDAFDTPTDAAADDAARATGEYAVFRTESRTDAGPDALAAFTYGAARRARPDGPGATPHVAPDAASDGASDAPGTGPADAALAAATAQLRLVTEAMTGFVYDYDVRTGRVVRSAGFREVLGIAPDEAGADAAWWVARMHEDDVRALSGAWAAATDDPRCDVFEGEYRVRHADGRWVWVQERARIVRDADGRTRRIVGVTSDVTARRAAERALRESEQRLRLAQQAALCGVWDGDPSVGSVRWSPEYYRLYGLDPAHVAPSYQAWLASIHPDDRARVHEETQRAVRSDVEHRTEFRVVRADTGATRWIASIGRVMRRDADGTPRRMIGIALDVTERHEAELAQRRQAEAMQALADRLAALQGITAALAGAMSPADVATIVIGRAREALEARAGAVTALEPAAPDRLRMLGSSGIPAAIVADWREYPVTAHAPMAEAVRTGRAVRLRSRGEMQARYPLRERDVFGPLGVESLLAVPVRAHGRTHGALLFLWAEAGHPDAEQEAFAQAVADQCAQALERAHLLEAERAARAAAEQARAEAERANRAKSDFLATMSHELRTPLNAIQGYAQLLAMEVHGPLAPPQHEALHRIARSQQHLLGLINAVLDLARIEAGRVDYDLADHDALALCAGVEALVRPLFEGRGLCFACPCPDAACLAACRGTCHAPVGDAAGDAPRHPALRVRCDEEKARQVLLNLCSNAAKFTPAGGRVTLAVRPTADGRHVAFAVHDTGIGIPADKHEAVFEPFVQVDGSRTRRAEGAGLGLAISRDLARGMGGELTVASVPGEGATFTLLLPVAGEGAIA